MLIQQTICSIFVKAVKNLRPRQFLASTHVELM